MPRCLLYYITDRTQFVGDESARRRQLLAKIAEAARWGVDYVQLREKDLPTRELEELAREAVRVVGENAGAGLRTRLLLNSRTDVALAAGADGVHLRGDDVSPAVVREIWAAAKGRTTRREAQNWLVGASCHSAADVLQAATADADFAVFAPVFEKAGDTTAGGLESLRQVCQASIPVFALGGVRLANAHSCLDAGARGIAGIRLFQQHDIGRVVEALRGY